MHAKNVMLSKFQAWFLGKKISMLETQIQRKVADFLP